MFSDGFRVYLTYDHFLFFSKMLDPDMSPLGFVSEQIYNFISKRINSQDIQQRMQALRWLQILTKLDISISLIQLFDMFNSGIGKTEYKFTKFNLNELNEVNVNDDEELSISK